MTLVRWIIERLSQRFVSVIGGLFAAHLETTVALEEAECQDLLEKRARQFEADGKPELAANLRQKAARISSQAPADGAVAAVKYLRETELSTTVALPAPQPDTRSTNETDETRNVTSQRPVSRKARRRSTPTENSD